MAEKAKRNKTIIKKNVLYVVWVVALVAVMATAIIVAASLSGGNSNMLDKGNSSGSSIVTPPESTGGQSSSAIEKPGEPETPGEDEGNLPDEPDAPVSGKVNFIMPVSGATVIKSYTENTLVFNSTLGAYMGHMGMDFSADAGTEVVCVYDGVVESVTTSYLTGTTVTVDHGNNLKTVYNSIDVSEALYEGATVAKGTVLGYVSENNLQEYKDGPHLHFEVLVSGETVNPDEYLIGEEK